MSEKIKLTYVMDPQCGWCYGNSKNITALEEEYHNRFDFNILVGGMWLEQNAPVGGDKLSAFLQHHAPRMTATTGAVVHDSYYGLAKDSSYSFSSQEPSAAIVLVKELAPKKVFAFAKKVQHALYVEGKRLDEKGTYLPLLKALSIETTAFDSLWMKTENISKTKMEFNEAQKVASGFPTLLFTKDGKTEHLASGYFNPDKIKPLLNAIQKELEVAK